MYTWTQFVIPFPFPHWAESPGLSPTLRPSSMPSPGSLCVLERLGITRSPREPQSGSRTLSALARWGDLRQGLTFPFPSSPSGPVFLLQTRPYFHLFHDPFPDKVPRPHRLSPATLPYSHVTVLVFAVCLRWNASLGEAPTSTSQDRDPWAGVGRSLSEARTAWGGGGEWV